MSRQLVISPVAEADIAHAIEWYEQQKQGLGAEFLAETKRAIAKAFENPQRFPRLLRKRDVRRVITDRFPYRVLYVAREDSIVVFRVLHAARHGREWKKGI